MQRTLLQIALGPVDEAISLWQGLQETFVLDELEPGSFDLMALIYRCLSAGEYDDPVVQRLKGIYRREWVRANLLAEHTEEIVATLGGVDVRALYVEGAPLADRFYLERGLRPSWFVDVLVEEQAFLTARKALAGAGWTASAESVIDPADPVALNNADRSVCVLRSSLSYDFVLPDDPVSSNRPLWESARTFSLRGAEIPVPGPTETLLAVCVSGARVKPIASIQWIVDAVMITRRDEIDFLHLVELARSRGQTLRLREALNYLSTLPETSIPGPVLAELDAAAVSLRERLAYTLAAGSLRAGGSLPEHASRHLAAAANRSLPGAVATFPGYLRRRWGLSHTWDLPFAAGRRIARRLRAS
jgi:hypothetical protein